MAEVFHEALMERFLIALDGTIASLHIVRYFCRLLGGGSNFHVTLFHVLPSVSPNLLKKEDVKRIERIHKENPHLDGYFWSDEDEARMETLFREAREMLIAAGMPPDHISVRFQVQSTETAVVILKEAEALGCSTIIMGRRGIGRVKEFILGSVSSSVVKMARDVNLWIVSEKGPADLSAILDKTSAS